MCPNKTITVNWVENTPSSAYFDDYYFSSDDGLAERNFVYILTNRLNDRFSSLIVRNFTIAETGFGTGLSFLSTWKLWKQVAPRGCSLNFISVEKYPISKEDLIKALSFWPELNEQADQLIELYPPPSPGFHRIHFKDNISLTLMLGDVVACYDQQASTVDAWFLDGFSPSKNPDMWTPDLFRQMNRLSHPKTTFATFTSPHFS